MSNQTSTSPKPKSNRTKELFKAGEWPPDNHPWRAVALLPPAQVQEWFRSPVWAALVEGLLHLQDDASATAMDIHKPSAVRDEACGMYNGMSELIRLPKVVKDFHDQIRED